MEMFNEKFQRMSGVNDVLNNQDMPVFKVIAAAADELHLRRFHVIVITCELEEFKAER